VGADFTGAASVVADAEAASRIQRLAGLIVRARKGGRPVALGMGAHPVKLGLGPHLTDLMRRGVVTSVAMNGAAAFHDLELAVFGATSEDVSRELPLGRFGFADDPARLYNEAAREAAASDRGLGEVIGESVARSADAGRVSAPDSQSGAYLRRAARARFSILAEASRLGITLTVHIAIGTDVMHVHPTADGAALGASSFLDFRRFLTIVENLGGGVYVNLGSAVVMPEVFLKAVSCAVNLGADLSGVVTANLDMLDHYRPRVNVIERISGALSGAGRGPAEGIDIRGRHEETVPALRACVLARVV
jgi:hypothetical protein